jgi:Bacterial Ig domain/Secretion system C-terminal sorting domain
MTFKRYWLFAFTFHLWLVCTNVLTAQNTCTNNFEPNNTFRTATPLMPNSTIRSRLATQGDEDFFKFQTNDLEPAFKVVLSDLPADYNLTVYRHDWARDSLIRIGESAQTGLNTETVAFDYLVDTATYYAVVRHVFNYHPLLCYSLSIENHAVERLDMSIDSILVPQGVYTVTSAENTFTPIIRVRNTGRVPISYFNVVQDLDGLIGSSEHVLRNPLQPNDTLVMPLLNRFFHFRGRHRFKVQLTSPNRGIDINPRNDTLSIFCQSFIAPSVALTEPTHQSILVLDSVIHLTATAAGADSLKIKKVEFYHGNTLIGSDTTRPYSYDWSRMPIGIYALTAKAIDEEGTSQISTIKTIYVTDTADAGVINVENLANFTHGDSAHPMVRIRNYGNRILNNVLIHSRLDNQTVVSQPVNGLQIRQGDFATIRLPNVQYTRGRHQLSLWTSAPNGVNDQNLANDTLNVVFETVDWGNCANPLEPNDHFQTATFIPTDSLIRSKLTGNDDKDFFKFQTTVSRPAFSVALSELGRNHGAIFSIYKQNYETNQTVYLSGSQDSVIFNTLADTGTYFVRVYGSTWDSTQCYALKVRTFRTDRYDIGIDRIFGVDTFYLGQDNYYLPYLKPLVQIRNTGNIAITTFRLRSGINDVRYFQYQDFRLPTPLLPDSTIIIRLDSVKPIIGYQNFGVCVYPNNLNGWRNDINTLNDTLWFHLKAVAPPYVYVLTPLNDQFFASNAQIPIKTYVDSHNGVPLMKVDFYNGNTLLSTDTTPPYELLWQNVPIGTYQLVAKAFNTDFYNHYSNTLTIHVSGAHDAGITQALNATTLVDTDSMRLQLQLRNFGLDSLHNVQFHYQLDSQPIEHQLFTNLALGSGRRKNFGMPLLRYAVGRHTLRAWTTLPNGQADLNAMNDTLSYSFDYQSFGTCSNDNYEPNNRLSQAMPMPTNRTIRSKLYNQGDEDYFKFTTTAQQPYFSVVLDELSQDHDFILYRLQDSAIIAETHQSGTSVDSILYTSNLDPATYVIRVYKNSGLNDCYALRVRTFEREILDVGVDRIWLPSASISTDTIRPRVRVRNYGNRAISGFKLMYSIDNQLDSMYFQLPTAILPNDTILLTLNAQTGYSRGFHRFMACTRYADWRDDWDMENDTLRTNFVYQTPPNIVLESPNDGQLYAPNSVIEYRATSDNLINGTVAFYNGSTLLGTDSLAPYTFRWTGAPIGTYTISAQAIDLQGFASTRPIKIHVTGNTDAGVIGVANAFEWTYRDSVRPAIQLRNFGIQPLTNVMIHYRLDNNPIVNQLLNALNLNQGDSLLTVLPMLRYSVGAHVFKVWTTLPNGNNDLNIANDSLTYLFDYQDVGLCSNNYEPNSSYQTAARIPLNTTVRSKLATAGDEDYFVFKTTAQQPNFTVVLNELLNNHDLRVYHWNERNQIATLLGASNQIGLNTDSVRIDFKTDAGTYMVKIDGNAGVNACYALQIRTFDAIRWDLGIDTLFAPIGEFTGTEFRAFALIHNYGSAPVQQFVVHYPLNNNYTQNVTLAAPLQPNDTIRVLLDRICCYPRGYHTFKVYVRLQDRITDVNPQNDTFSTRFRHIVLARMEWVTPIQGQLFAPDSTISLRADISWSITPIQRVEFYKDGTLLYSDTTAPYRYDWNHVSVGSYNLIAQSIDTEGVRSQTGMRTVHVSGNADAGIVEIVNDMPFTHQDSIHPVLQIRNFGMQPLTHVMVHYRLDNNAVTTQMLNNLHINRDDSMTLTLPMLRYGTGLHTFTAWTTLPNGAIDQNTANDTLKYVFEKRDYSICRDYETLENLYGAVWIPTDVIVRSNFDSLRLYDSETFIFKTTAEHPYFKVTLKETLYHQAIYIYKYSLKTNTGNFVVGWHDSVSYTGNHDSSTYYIVMPNGSGNQCYSLKVNTFAVMPSVILTAPIYNQVLLAPAQIPLEARITGGSLPIRKVQFYTGNQLISTDSTAPYQNLWTGAPLGTHLLTAKATDTAGNVVQTTPITIQLVGEVDAGVNRIANAVAFTYSDSLQPAIRIQNNGAERLTQVQVHYRFDNNPVVSQTLTGLQLNWLDTTVAIFPHIGYTYGWHTLLAWTTLPNGLNDQQPLNDTLFYSFQSRNYGICVDYEPNGSFVSATQIPTDVVVRSKFNGWLDEDYFAFTTTNDRPYFTATLKETPPSDFSLYQYDGVSYQRVHWGFRSDSITYNQNPKAGKYIVSATSSQVGCYALKITTFERPYTRVQDLSKAGFRFQLAPNPAKDQVQILLESDAQLIDYQLIVTNMIGRQLFKSDLNMEQLPYLLSTEGWASGMYFVSIRRDGRMVTEKLVIE